jgi:hypothetical protein
LRGRDQVGGETLAADIVEIAGYFVGRVGFGPRGVDLGKQSGREGGGENDDAEGHLFRVVQFLTVGAGIIAPAGAKSDCRHECLRQKPLTRECGWIRQSLGKILS